MTDESKVKLCWNCDGNLAFNDENCPYCGVYVSPIEGGDVKPVAAPYNIEEVEEGQKQEVPPAPYEPQQQVVTPQPEVAVKAMEQEELHKQAVAQGIAHILTPMALLVAGSLFFFFSLVLLLFSQEGLFTLSWNGDHWYLYLLTSLTMLFFGWKTLHRIDEE